MKSSGQVSIVNIPVASHSVAVNAKQTRLHSGEWGGNLRNRAAKWTMLPALRIAVSKPQMRLPDKERDHEPNEMLHGNTSVSG